MSSKISALTGYTPPLDADVLPIVDTANTTTKKVTWANLKATIKTYLDSFYAAVTGNVVTIGTGTLTLGASKTPTISNTLTIAGVDGKTFTVNKTLTLDGTDSTTMTFPTTSATIARTDAANTFTGIQTVSTITAPSNASISVTAGTSNTIQTYTPTGGGTATLDLSKGNIHHITMPAGNITIALSNATTGQCFIIRILQDSGGSRSVTWFTTIKWAGGSAPTLTTTASKADTLGFEITGSNTYDAFVVGQNL